MFEASDDLSKGEVENVLASNARDHVADNHARARGGSLSFTTAFCAASLDLRSSSFALRSISFNARSTFATFRAASRERSARSAFGTSALS